MFTIEFYAGVPDGMTNEMMEEITIGAGMF
jgi:hypothetical protein